MLIQEPNLFIMLMLLAVVGCAVPTALAQLEQQDIFVRGKSGYHTYRIPSLLVTTKGTLLAFCEGRKNSASDTGDIDLLLKRSADGGRTWGQHQVVWDDGPNTCGNPCPVLDETAGVVWLLMTHNPAGLNERQIQARKVSGGRTVWVTRSEDDGKSWSAPSNITSSAKDPAWGWYATGPGVGIQIQHGPHKGRMIIPCDHSYPSPSASPGSLSTERGAHVIYSDDHGQTWRLGGTVRPKMNECQIAELADGEGGLLLSLRNYCGGYRRAQSASNDGGQTWTPPQLHAQLPDPVCQASIVRYNWPDKHEPGRLLFSNPASTNRQNLTVRVSHDDGKSWERAKTLHPNAAAYSCLAVLPDDSIGCLYERGKKNPYEEITFARFPLSWLGEKE